MKKTLTPIISKLTIILICAFALPIFANYAFAQNNDFAIIPESSDINQVINAVNTVWKSGWKVIENYKDVAYWAKNPDWTRQWSDMSLWDQLASWIMTRDTLLDYVTYIVRFLLQLWLFVWAVVMIYIWYEKITEFRDFKWGKLKYVIIWIAVITFAYVIIKTITSMFIE
jgi:hypothetical protein